LKNAAKYYKLAADQNHAKAQFRYGLCLERGRGMEIDLIEAAHYYKLSADHNFVRAQRRYRSCLEKGKGVMADRVEALKYLKLSADQNSLEAQFKYAVCLTEGDRVNMDWIEAARYFRLAGGSDREWQGDERLLKSGAPLNRKVAGQICKRFKDHFSRGILNSIGRWFEFGEYTGKDVKVAAQCYSIAATVGDSSGQVNYGFCVEHGLGVERNPFVSIEFYKESMIKGNGIGSGHYALSVHFGIGCFEDVESALDHYDFVMETERSFVTDNSDRCHRGLNRLSPHKPEMEREPPPDLHKSTTTIDMVDLILRYKVEAIKWKEGLILGTGASGRVTRENDPKNPSNQIAVKWFTSFTDLRLFRGEVETLVKLRHPCIIEILAWWQDERNTFGLQMKLARNGALTDHLIRGRRANLGLLWKRNRRALIICDLVIGMRYVHSHGIMHRDLKPDNILLDEDFRVMISDFGLSRSQSATGLPSPQVGTYDYAAPEQWNTVVGYTVKVDVFAFGLIAYEILTGRRVPRCEQSRLPVAPASFGPPVLENLIRRCWSLNPSERPSFEAIFNEFVANGWDILPDADSDLIAKSVSKVLSLENHLNRQRV
jgi:TPR repeat protein